MSELNSLVQTTFKKLIISGDIIELYEYEKIPYQLSGGNRQRTDETDIDWIDDFEDESGSLSDEIKANLNVGVSRLASNINRTRNMVRRLILANFDSNSKFVTLTFRENITDLSEANKHFHRFIKRLRRKYSGFKYIAVVEFQKRGAVHYHMLSDLPYIKSSELECIWGNGFIKINRITHVDNVGAYVIKYMTKDLSDERLYNNKSYNCSKGLTKPVVLRGDMAEELITLYSLEKGKEVYTNHYISEYLGLISYKEYNLKRGILEHGVKIS